MYSVYSEGTLAQEFTVTYTIVIWCFLDLMFVTLLYCVEDFIHSVSDVHVLLIAYSRLTESGMTIDFS